MQILWVLRVLSTAAGFPKLAGWMELLLREKFTIHLNANIC